MRTLAHLSDLHFDRVDQGVLEALRRRVKALAPDLVVISGDLTQRARAHQFRAARAFLDSLPKPQVVVPGNHDVPLYNVLARFVAPLAGYRRVIGGNVEPGFVDDEIAVLGINTARSLVFKGGRVSESQLARVGEALGRLEGERTRIVVSHHPAAALEKLAHRGVDVFISGHHHATRTAQRRIGGMSVLIVEAGTATSQRTREEPNAFNLLRIAAGRIEIDHYALRGENFTRAASEAFARKRDAWEREDSA
ncbi:MAG: metallophosphoesterase family protein [Burkholderiales bacterium]